MRTRFVFSIGILLVAALLLPLGAYAADITGKWQGTMQTPDRQSLEITFQFQQDGEKLTGTTASSYGQEQITEGSVKGDAVSFVVMAGGGNFRIVYKGKLAGDDLKFTVTIGDMGDRELTAKRVK